MRARDPPIEYKVAASFVNGDRPSFLKTREPRCLLNDVISSYLFRDVASGGDSAESISSSLHFLSRFWPFFFIFSGASLNHLPYAKGASHPQNKGSPQRTKERYPETQ